MSYYSEFTKFYIAVDCIVFGYDAEGLKLLVLKKDFEPEKGKWSLMGGFLQEGESTDRAAARVLYNLTGLRNVFLEQLAAFEELTRDSGDRVISIAYYALININDHNSELVEKNNASWVNFQQVPNLVFDHNAMVDKSIKRLRRKAATEPIGFNLLPIHFTLTQLQKMYEAIFQKEFDKRNFRKKILLMDVLEKLNIKDKTSSKRGAYLYRFNARTYEQFVNEGSMFGI